MLSLSLIVFSLISVHVESVEFCYTKVFTSYEPICTTILCYESLEIAAKECHENADCFGVQSKDQCACTKKAVDCGANNAKIDAGSDFYVELENCADADATKQCYVEVWNDEQGIFPSYTCRESVVYELGIGRDGPEDTAKTNCDNKGSQCAGFQIGSTYDPLKTLANGDIQYRESVYYFSDCQKTFIWGPVCYTQVELDANPLSGKCWRYFAKCNGKYSFEEPTASCPTPPPQAPLMISEPWVCAPPITVPPSKGAPVYKAQMNINDAKWDVGVANEAHVYWFAAPDPIPSKYLWLLFCLASGTNQERPEIFECGSGIWLDAGLQAIQGSGIEDNTNLAQTTWCSTHATNGATQSQGEYSLLRSIEPMTNSNGLYYPKPSSIVAGQHYQVWVFPADGVNYGVTIGDGNNPASIYNSFNYKPEPNSFNNEPEPNSFYNKPEPNSFNFNYNFESLVQTAFISALVTCFVIAICLTMYYVVLKTTNNKSRS